MDGLPDYCFPEIARREEAEKKFRKDVKELLKEVRAAITEVNKGAGHTVFNPAITQLVESMQKEIAES